MQIKTIVTNKLFLKNLGYVIGTIVLLTWLTLFGLRIYTRHGSSVSTPDFRGKTLDQIESIAENSSVRYTIEDSVYRKDVKPGSVVFQNPAPGHKIKPNRIISLTLASSTPDQVAVPKVTDVSLRQARVLLESKGFALGNVEFRPSEYNDLVLEQKYRGVLIAPDSRLDNGAAIDLVVGTSGAGSAGSTTVPSLIGKPIREAKGVLSSKTLELGSVIYDSSILGTADTLKAVVWKQSPVADSTKFVRPGTAIDVWMRLSADTTKVN